MCIDTSNVFGGFMRLFKNIFALLLTGVMTVNMGCGMHNEIKQKDHL